MKKIILLLTILLIVTGCSANYEIIFDKDIISENIDFEFDGNIYDLGKNAIGDGEYIEEELIQKYVPMLNINNKSYERSIEVKNNKSYVKLSGNYSYDELKNSYIINHCFDSIYINNTDNYIDISLKDLICSNTGNLNLKISSIYTILNNNADNIKDGYYNWSLKTISDKGIEFRIIKEEKKSNKNGLEKTFIIILIVMFVISGGTLYILKKNEY